MKIVTSCPHVTPDPKKWFNAKDEGTYAMIVEMCMPCMATTILKKGGGLASTELYDPLELFKDDELPEIKRYKE